MKLTKILFKGWGVNQFDRPNGIWVTDEQINELVRRQYDPDRCDKPMRLGGKWVYPKNFIGEDRDARKTELEDLVNDSSTFNSDNILGLAEAGYLQELLEIDCGGYSNFVNKLAESGQYKLEGGSKKQIEGNNSEGLKQLEDLKNKFKINIR